MAKFFKEFPDNSDPPVFMTFSTFAVVLENDLATSQFDF